MDSIFELRKTYLFFIFVFENLYSDYQRSENDYSKTKYDSLDYKYVYLSL